jgi:hypothetical protein
MTTPVLAVRFRTPKTIVNGVRLIAEVKSNSKRNQTYAVLFVDGVFRGVRRRTVLCPCNDFHFRKEGRFHSCIHTRNARRAKAAS